MMTHVNNIRGTRLIDVPHLPVEQAIKLLMQKSVWVREAVVKHCYRQISLQKQGESVNILLNFTQFLRPALSTVSRYSLLIPAIFASVLRSPCVKSRP